MDKDNNSQSLKNKELYKGNVLRKTIHILCMFA